MDAVGSNIRIDARLREVMRVLPRINDEVNEEWIHDKTRHACDGLLRRRLDRPWVRREGKLQPATWAEAFEHIAARLHGAGPEDVAAIAGDLQDVESIYAAKALLRQYGSSLHECRQDGAEFDVSTPAAYRFNATIAGIETAPAILLIGANPRWEAPLVNTRIRKAIKAGSRVFRIGEPVDLTYPVTDLGNDLALLGRLPREAVDALRGKEGAAVIVGTGALMDKQAYQAARILTNWLGASFNLLHTAAARVGALDLGFSTPGGLDAIRSRAGALKALFLLGADEADLSAFADTFTVYVGTHGDAGVRVADVILPAAAYTEKHGTWVNMEGRVQLGERAVDPPGEARVDWTIFRALSDVLGKRLPFDDLSQLRAAIAAEHPHLAVPGLTVFGPPPVLPGPAPTLSGPIAYPIQDFYLTNPIARASPTLQRCSAEILHGQDFAEAAE
jgi:NADH-quinone oxidoreductase subunit G